MKTSEQIKGAIRNISKKTGVNPNSLLQMCLFEGILEKLSKSKYSENFILKGGLLISSLIGVDMRSTMDMDTTIKGIPLNEVSITKILNEILAIKIDADIEYKLIKLSPIRQEDVLSKAIERTSKYRGSFETALQYKEIVELFRESEIPKELWKKYTQNNPYAKDVDFLDTISVYEEIGIVLNVNDDTK